MQYTETYDNDKHCYIFKFEDKILHVYIDSIPETSSSPDTRDNQYNFVKEFILYRYGVHVSSDGFGYYGQHNNEKFIIDVFE